MSHHLRLRDVLSADGREASSACGQVDFDDAMAPDGSQTLIRSIPPNPHGPTPVDIAIFVLAVDGIETATNSFRLEAYARLTWCDPRLAFDPDETGLQRKVFDHQAALDRLTGMWWPGLFIPRQIGTSATDSELLVIHHDGTVRFSLKTNPRISAEYDFTDFPMDHQPLEITLQPALLRADAVELRANHELTGADQRFEIPEWTVIGSESLVEAVELPDGSSFSRFVLRVEIARKLGYYVWKVGLPLVLIFGVSWSVFWMSRDALAQRQRQAATGLLTLVAYQFVASADVPRVSYLTFLDAVFLWSFVVVTLAMPLNVWNHRRYRRDQLEGVNADRRWRWLYPCVYGSGIVAILIWHWIR